MSVIRALSDLMCSYKEPIQRFATGSLTSRLCPRSDSQVEGTGVSVFTLRVRKIAGFAYHVRRSRLPRETTPIWKKQPPSGGMVILYFPLSR